MMLPYVFHPIAAVEIEDAVDYYESLQPGKGLELAEQVEAAIKQIQIFPESAPIAGYGVRHDSCRDSCRFPLMQSAGRPGGKLVLCCM